MTTPWAMVRAAARFAFGAPEGVPDEADVAEWCDELKSTKPDKGENV
jgi:hypothetical protein